MEISELEDGLERLKELNKQGLISDEIIDQSEGYLRTAKNMDNIIKRLKNGNK
jgi:hypothetical protein